MGNSLPLSYFQVGVFLLEFKQVLEAVDKVTLILEVNFGKLFEALKAEKLCNFLKSFLSDGEQLVKDPFYFFDEIYFGVLAVI